MAYYENVNGELELRAGSTLYADNPIGAIVPFGGTNIPAGFLLCNGAEVSKTDYAELYAVIGDAFGTASVNTKFVLPDLREATTKGAGLTGKTVGAHLDADGLDVGEFLDDRIQNITLNVTNGAGGMGDRLSMGGGTVLNTPLVSVSTGFRYGATTEVKSVGVNYIIKAKMIGVPADFMSAVDEYLDTENILWENQSPDSAFSAQDVTLANDNYKYLTIYYKEYSGRNYYLSVKFPKGVGCYLNKIDVSGNDYYVYSRICSYTNSTKLHFADAYQSSQSSANNGHCIPIKIVGSMT